MKIFSSLSHRVFITVTVSLIILFLLIATYGIFEVRYRHRLYPGIRIAGIEVGGLTLPQAREKINHLTDRFNGGLIIRHDELSLRIADQAVALNPDVPELVTFDLEATVVQAARIGRGKFWFDNLSQQINAIVHQPTVPVVVSVDRLRLSEALRQTFSSRERTMANAALVIQADNSVSIEPGHEGLAFNYEATVEKIIEQLQRADNHDISMVSQVVVPEVQTAEIAQIEGQLDRWLSLPPLTLQLGDKTWKIANKTMRDWLSLDKEAGRVVIAFDKQKVAHFLETEIAPVVNVEAKSPRLEISNGRASVWQGGQDGVQLQVEPTVEQIIAWSKSAQVNEADAVVTVATTITSNTDVDQGAEDLGLREVIGVGVSQFAGSPKNRRHNIAVGANALHGLLIKPGEEFSLLKALGEIDASSGYLPELVIKENRTVPEYGGGLCQIGTTMFRATFNSGLPVTQRRNHSYRVVYYEPAGTDATIYDPAPDYRFINDTGHYILIQAKIEGNELRFEFWGTKDGRQVETTKPVVYNVTPPPATKMVETADLAPGEKKCTESAHAGADAYFDYKVTYATGEVKEKRFTSHYVPWQAVCLVGVAAPEVPPTSPTSTITPTVSPEL